MLLYFFIEVSDKIQVNHTLDHALNLGFQTVPHAVPKPSITKLTFSLHHLASIILQISLPKIYFTPKAKPFLEAIFRSFILSKKYFRMTKMMCVSSHVVDCGPHTISSISSQVFK